MKIALIIACIGHIICGITYCMLAYMKNGRFEFSDVKDNKKMQKVFEGASLKQIELSCCKKHKKRPAGNPQAHFNVILR